MLDQIGTHEEVMKDVQIKERRLLEFMEKQGLEAVIINRQDSFAWLTAGGDNRVITTSENGFAFLVITPKRKWIVAHSIDILRFLEEQVPGQGFEPVQMHWYEGMPVDKVTELVKGLKVGADIPLAGTQFLGAQIPTLFFPLTDLDIRRLRWVGKTNHDLLTTIARQIEPGMTELEIAAEIQRAYTRRNMTLDVLIVGVDERVFRYRHPLPTERVLKNYALLHPAARRWGLHANVTRLVHFGPLPNEIQRAVDGVLTIEGRILGMISEGMHFADVLVEQKRWYSEVGFPEDWRYHFQGGITSYSLADPTQSLNPAARMVMRQAFDYFVTITGAKSEELVLLTEEGVEIASFGGDWPRRAIKTPRGEFEVPDILIRS